MASHTLFLFLLLSLAFQLFVSLPEDYYHECTTVPYSCGGLHLNVSYPFLIDHRPGYCGHPDFLLSCINDNTTLMITINGTGYQVKDIDYPNELLTVVDTNFVGQTCPHTYQNTTLDPSLFRLSDRDLNLSLYFNCTSLLPDIPTLYDIACLAAIFGKHSYYRLDNQSFPDFLGTCFSTAVVPLDRYAAEQLWNVGANLTAALQQGFSLNWIPGSDWCSGCTHSGGICGYNSSSPPEHTCFCSNFTGTDSCNSPGNHNDNGKKIAIGVSAAVGGFILACVLCLLGFRHKKRQERITSSALMRSASSEPPSRKDPELGKPNYQTHLFSYQELQEATNCFDASKELGDGGYGTVYKGKLRDGRIVAVKRLYENNYRRVEQFMNEIEILSRLRHKNLVTLYGCTSHQSRELLLVYEFVPNGTVADHLHGSRASEGGLTWPIRLSIAIETADSLSYLHAVEPPIIHRDVKTNNILLDGSFHVKVADFGLSRLFPIDATHVSTAPQGTPGYLDPEYHQCFQLTDKSDVYSFGVVLIELISSKPAVDITRHRHEINLATMAINKIQNCELEELVDPGLGYESDSEVRRMITQVAELAFRCLQWDKDMRPPMKEALEVLREIESGGLKVEETLDADALMQGDVTLMKKSSPLLSPDSVTERWASRSTTPNNSG